MAASRIVTLLPSATEIVCGLGLRDRLVGVTHECDFPSDVASLPRVTTSAIDISASSREIDTAVRDHLQQNNSLYSIDVGLLAKLEPDLLVTQALCDVCAVSQNDVLDVLAKLPGDPQLINLEPMTLDDVFETISRVGASAGCAKVAENYKAELKARVVRVLRASGEIRNKPRVGFLEWLDPPFNAGHWTPELIEFAGGIDCFGNKYKPSTTIALETIAYADPDVLIIALCGFDEERARIELDTFKQRIDFDSLQAVKNGRVYVLDGNSYFSRPGPRLVDALELLFELLHQ